MFDAVTGRPMRFNLEARRIVEGLRMPGRPPEVPDGRSVRTLVNSTPIRAAGGAVESVVVTMQDLAPFDEIERMRTEFLGLVSHELRAPLISIKGSADALLEEAAELDPAEMGEFHRIIAEQAGHMRDLKPPDDS